MRATHRLSLPAILAAAGLATLPAAGGLVSGAARGATLALQSYWFVTPDTLANGTLRPLTRLDTVEILTLWEVPERPAAADSLEVTGDFSRLNPLDPAAREVRGRPRPGGYYALTYTLPGVVTRADSSHLVIPLTARLGSEATSTDRRIEVCLSNRPPEHLASRIVRPKERPYRTGDSLVVETVWRASEGLLMDGVRLDLSAILLDPGAVEPRVERVGEDAEGIFLLRYRLPLGADAFLPGGAQKPVGVIGADRGCGVTAVDVFRLDIDVVAPSDDGLSLDPLPSVVTSDSVEVAGRAEGCAFVLIYRNRFALEVVPADSVDARFRSTIPLLRGENEIQIRGEDLAGNGTTIFPIPAAIVTRLGSPALTVAHPYSRRDLTRGSDDISLRDPAGMTGARIRVFNLEGDCLWEERASIDGARELIFHWTGRDREGERAPQGYYLVRAEWTSGTGKSESRTSGLFLKD